MSIDSTRETSEANDANELVMENIRNAIRVAQEPVNHPRNLRGDRMLVLVEFYAEEHPDEMGENRRSARQVG